ncbi:MAG: SDR family NAD(P)-dependent oxidoreductase [Myxococcota bacterium]|nr:SDR family NAD(P)-dependent oxidoreductase [Myxococcota bacterium]
MAQKHQPIAIVGVSALFPGSQDKTGFWRDILGAEDMIRDIPETHWLIDDYYDANLSAPDKTYGRRGAFLDEVSFNPIEFGVPPSIMPATDTAQLLGLIVAQQVLNDATNGQFATMDKERCSVILGVTSAQELLGNMVSRLQRPVWQKSLREAGIPESKVEEVCERIASEYVPWQESTFPGLLGNVVAGRIANRLNLGGTNCVTDAACASSFSALMMAVNELSLGQSDMVVTGGVDTMNDIFMYMCFSKTPALSKTGDCRPFSDGADGTILGEGIGMVALKRLEDAERDGDRIYAVIKGVGASSDGKAKSVYAPVPEGQAKALKRAYEAAGYSPGTVELVEGHGTGTTAGDAAEFKGLCLTFEESDRHDTQWCSLGSVKSQIGHTKAAAGAAGLFKVVMALHHKVLPPTIKIDTPNPKLELEKSPFNLNTRPRPWIRGAHHPRRASVSSFGFGGSNYHLALEEYVGDAPAAWRSRTARTEMVVYSAKTPAALAQRLRGIEVKGDGCLSYLARESQAETDIALAARVAIVAEDEADLGVKLIQAAELVEKTGEGSASVPTGIYFGFGQTSGDIGFLFPGQGSQYLDMGAGLAMEWQVAQAPWDVAANIDMDADASLHEVVFPISAFTREAKEAQEQKLVATQWAQPAIGVTSLSQLSLLDLMGVKPAAVAGHSFGEVTALHAAGVLDQESMIRVARRRGELMRDAAATPGSMIAVVATLERVRELLPKDCRVVVANHNAPEQIVLSGKTAAVDEVAKLLVGAGLKVRPLKVATAFHSEVVSASVKPFADFLKGVKVKKPTLPIYGCSEASPYPAQVGKIRSLLSSQIAKPVRFLEQVEAMYEAGIRTFIEVGPGNVLSNLTGRILKGREHRAIQLDRKGKHGVTSLHHGLAQLFVAGVAMDLTALWEAYAEQIDPRTLKKAPLELQINGANYGKPYPPAGGSAKLPAPNPELEPEIIVKEVIKEVPVEVPVYRETPAPAAEPTQPVQAPTAPVAAVMTHPQAHPQHALTGDAYGAWLGAFQQVQQQTIEAHAAWQKTMADTHLAFLQSAEATLLGLTALAGGPRVSTAPAIRTQPTPVSTALPTQAAAPVMASPAPVAPAVPVATAIEPIVVAQAQPRVSAPAPVAAPAPRPKVVVGPAAPAQSALNLHALLLEVVAEKTGYPADMLTMEMELETDLGVDSIKRVEILSAITERAPSLPDIDPTAMADLKTLGQIVEHMGAQTSPLSQAEPVAVAAEATPIVSSAEVNLHSLLLEVVSEKTGYPADMLTMEMELETDLGVDSIKRVEILSAITEKVPHLPDVDPAAMADLKTLGQIVEHLGVTDGLASAVESAVPAPVPTPAPSAHTSLDLNRLLLEVVAEKTGYPADMLTMEMELETDLGVDSIKRVEILSAITEKAPELPDVDPAAMAELKTLGQIVDHMGKHVGVTAHNTTDTTQSSDVAVAPGVARYILEAVEAPARGLAMPHLYSVQTIIITDCGTGVAQALARRFEARGLHAMVCDTVPVDAHAVVYLGGLKSTQGAADDESIHKDAFLAAKQVATGLVASPGVFVTVQDTGGRFGRAGITNPWLGGLSGLVKTAAIEWPEASVRAIDIERGGRSCEAIAEALDAELFEGGGGLEVGLSASGGRVTLRSVSREVEGGQPGVRAGDVIIASGGARGVTAATLIELAHQVPVKLALFGRTPLTDEPAACHGVDDEAGLKRALLDAARASGQKVTPAELGKQTQKVLGAREIRATLQAIRAAGSEADYYAVDIRDSASIGEALSAIRTRWGAIDGIVHGAGVLADKLIADKTEQEWLRVFQTKVDGLRALLEATSADPITMISLFSSVAARGGNRGQSDYAMANEVLNKVAVHEAARRGHSCTVKSFNWGPWQGGMVTPALEAHFAGLGVPVIPLKVGAQMFVRELLASSRDEIEIVVGGNPNRVGLSGHTKDGGIRMEVSVSRKSHPYLADHAIGDIPVLPVVLVLDWFTRAASAVHPALELGSCKHLKVLRGIRLTEFEDRGDRFQIVVMEREGQSGPTLDLALQSLDGTLHYSAEVELQQDVQATIVVEEPTLKLQPWNDAVYGDVLFHGPEFQVIRALDGIADQGGVATLAGVTEAGWHGGWHSTDTAALDGGLQLALLWGKRVLGGASLPTGVGAYQVYQKELTAQPIRCTLERKSVDHSKAICDLRFTNHDGQLLAELRDVETHLLPFAKSN